MVNEIYDSSSQIDVKSISSKLNLDYEKLHKDFNSKEVERTLLSEIELANSNNITATPSLVINDVVYVGSMPYKELLSKVKLAHKRVKNNKN